MAKKVKKCEECTPGLPGWLATFADLMSLLLCFFILLLAFSTTEIVKFKRAMGSLKAAFGVLPREVTVIKKREVYIPTLSDSQNKKLRAAVKRMKDKRIGADKRKEQQAKEKEKKKEKDSRQKKDQQKKEADQVKLQITQKGVAIRISNDMLFQLGSSNLNSNIFELLDLAIDVTKGWPNSIRIEGHTDNIPINTLKYPSNWELSSARALSVLKYFIKNGISPEKISATGYGEYRPLAPNNTYENRGKNRRVEIFINYDSKVPDNIVRKLK